MLKKGATDYDPVLYTGAERGDKDMVELMLKKGATGYETGIHFAYKNGHEDIAQLIQSYMQKAA